MVRNLLATTSALALATMPAAATPLSPHHPHSIVHHVAPKPSDVPFFASDFGTGPARDPHKRKLTLPTPAALGSLLGSIPWTNGRGLVTGSTLLSVHAFEQQLFNSMGTWDANGNYTPNVAAGSLLPSVINGLKPVATSGAASDVSLTQSFTGSTAQALNGVVNRTIYLDAGQGAAADGVTDDTVAANRVLGLMTPGGILQLQCDRSYFFNGAVQVVGAVRVRQCAERPAVVYDQTTLGFPGSDLSFPHVILGPSGTFNLARGGTTENMVLVASSITSLSLPDASLFAGTALTQAAGSLGLGISAHNLVLLGFAQCYDGSNGGATIDFRDIVGDCAKGFNFGTSQGATYLNSLQLAPYLTSQFAGYSITAITGNGASTVISYTGPVIAVGNQINLVNPATGNATLVPGLTNNVPYKVTASTGSSSVTSASTATVANTGLNGTATAQGFAQNYNPQYYRQTAGQTTYGYLFSQRSDDTHFGDLGDFGHDVAVDAQSAAFLSGKHLWCDNNNVACLRNVGHMDLSVGEITALNVQNAYLGVSTLPGGSGGGQQSVSTWIGKLWGGSTFGDCVEVSSGTLFVGALHCEHVGVNGSGYAINIGDPTAYVMVASGTLSSLATGAVASLAPQDHLAINVKWTDAQAGASIYTGSVPAVPTLASAATIQPSVNLDKAVVTGTNTISSIGGGSAGRELTLDCTAACVFSNSGGIAGFTIIPKGGATSITGPGVFKFMYESAVSAWRQEGN